MCLAQQQTPLKVEDIQIQQRERRERDDRRGERRDRDGSRGERGERKSRSRDRASGPMDTYRIEVGRDHGVQVKNIVGAIANEADISSKFIGEIRLFNEHSTVQLPQNMPSDVLSHFKSVHICQRPMNMTKSTHPADQGQGRGEEQRDRKRSFKDPRSGGGDKRRPEGQRREKRERKEISFS